MRGEGIGQVLNVCVCDVHARVQVHFYGYVLQTWNPGLLEYQESRAAQDSRKMAQLDSSFKSQLTL